MIDDSWVQLTSEYSERPVMIRRDGQLALTPSESRHGGSTVYAAGKVFTVKESFDAVCSAFSVFVA